MKRLKHKDYKPCASAISKHNWGNITHEGKFKKKPEWGDFWNFKKNSHENNLKSVFASISERYAYRVYVNCHLKTIIIIFILLFSRSSEQKSKVLSNLSFLDFLIYCKGRFGMLLRLLLLVYRNHRGLD